MALTIAVEAIDNWIAVAQNAIVESGIITISGHYHTSLHLQAALDTVTAHTGTRFIIQVSQQAAGDEDWQDLLEFVALVGTAKTDLIENNPLAAASTVITLTGHLLTVEGVWLFIEDSTLVNSELILESAQAANSVTILDGTANAHALNTAIFDIAISKVLAIAMGTGMRARLVIDNSYDNDGSSLNYKLNAVKTTAI